jgi:iron complex transport system ATP-binding protein
VSSVHPSPAGPGLAVAVTALSLRYGSAEVLRDVSLRIAPGERLCLVGPNGAGKSSLLRCLTGLVSPTSGSIELDGRPLAQLDRAAVARAISVVPAAMELPFSMRVEEVVALGRLPHEDPFAGPGEADRAAVDAAMRKVGIEPLRGRDVQQLSMGERQLVLLAMAVAQGGRLLVLDEPTVHLDLRHQVEVMTLLQQLSATGLTVVAVLHDLPLASHFFERLALMHEGRLLADGAPASVLAPTRIREVYAVDPRFVPALG